MRLALALALSALSAQSSLPAQAPEPTGAFESIALRGGGEVVVRHGPTHRVSLSEGDRRSTPIRVESGRLTIDHCHLRCPRGHRLRVEVVTPYVAALSVSDGGMIRSEGGFPRLARLDARVRQGGAIDIRSIAVADLTASVAQGGVILARPERRLDASVVSGGRITYWGHPAVRRSGRDGGVIERGRAGDLIRPMADLSPRVPPLPPVPPLPGRVD